MYWLYVLLQVYVRTMLLLCAAAPMVEGSRAWHSFRTMRTSGAYRQCCR